MESVRRGFNLIPDTQDALIKLKKLTSLSDVDHVNRGVQLLAFVEEQQRQHGKKLVLVSEDGTIERLTFF